MYWVAKSFFLYLIIFLVSLFLIFFVGIDFDEDTWEESMTITSQWLQGFKKWLDVAWWVRLTYRIDYSRYEEIYTDQAELNEIKSEIEWIILSNIDDRISALWVSDYTSYIQSIWQDDYVVVEIGWVVDTDAAKDIIWRTVELEFKLKYEWEDEEEVRDSRKVLAEEALISTVNDELSLAEIYQDNIDNDYHYNNYDSEIDDLPSFLQDNFDSLIEAWEGNIYPSLLSNDEEERWDIVRYLWQEEDIYSFEVLSISYFPTWVTATDPASWQMLNAAFFNYASVWTTETWDPSVLVHFNRQWAQIYCNITSQNVWEQMAIFVWWELITDPVIREEICWWTSQITWNFTRTEAREMVDDLNDWAMPAPLILSHEEMVSPTLWADALSAAIIAAAVWFFLVFLFMIYFYWLVKWLVAITTLLVFVSILFWLIKVLWYALSLSWIAAIILSIWIAVDANVLIFERVREEMKSWKWTMLSIQDWFARSLSAIRDGNLTTWLIWLLLFMVWTNIFRWFGTMMLVNIMLILTVVVPLTKIMLILLYSKFESISNDDK